MSKVRKQKKIWNALHVFLHLFMTINIAEEKVLYIEMGKKSEKNKSQG